MHLKTNHINKQLSGYFFMSKYVKTRKSLFYYQYIQQLINVLASDAKSMIDIGAHQTTLLEECTWIPERYALDIINPYESSNIKPIKADFMEYQPKFEFDFAICLQVLEHINDAERFAKKIFKIAKHVIISVPYQWPIGSDPAHIHDPVDEAKLHTWVSRKPSYQIIVNEIFSGSRLICYYHPLPGTNEEKQFIHNAKLRMRQFRESFI
jgi:hypothetical protein